MVIHFTLCPPAINIYAYISFRSNTCAGKSDESHCQKAALTVFQAVFLAYMAVLKKHTSVGLSAVLIALTAFVKIL